MGYEIMMLGAKTCRFRFGATALLCTAFWSGVPSAQTPEPHYRVEGPGSYYEYYIFPGAVLQISVYQHPELSKTVVVTPNGEITLAWLNAAKVVGRSFRAIPSAIQSIENNLSIANMGFSEFARATDLDGIFRRFPAP